MCGIVGAVGDPVARADGVRHMQRLLLHRGPDDAGEYHDDDCSLAMRRLSIIDVAGGHQPLFNETRDVVAVCNGELYDFQAVRRSLETFGHTFATRSDVETAIHAYEHWGDRFLSEFNGMFALAIWDRSRRRLLLARDRLGKKPLYYATTPAGLAFSSELRSLAAWPDRTWTLDRDACHAFLLSGYLPDDRTPMREIRRLPPGHLGVWERGEFRVQRYWQPEPTPSPATYDAAQNTLLRLLEDAVALRLISDVPLGAFLSGGLDSSLVVAVAAGRLGARIPTFTIAFPGYADHDEAPFARTVAEHFGCEHHEIPVDAHAFQDLPGLVWALDEPLADPAALPTLLLSREAKRHVTVALTGEGADEVFGGYERYAAALAGSALSRRLWLGSRAARIALQVRGDRSDDDSRTSRLLRAWADGRDDPLAWSRATAVAAAVQPALDGAILERSPSAPAASPSEGNHRLAALQLEDLFNMLPNGLLTKVDRMTMAASLEARCPFLDYRIVEFGLGLPDAWKIRGRTTKILLRAAAARLLPGSMHRRAKHTFRVPLAQWLRGPLRSLALEAAESPALAESGIILRERARDLAQRHIAGRADYSRTLWSLITLHLWLTAAARQFTLQTVP